MFHQWTLKTEMETQKRSTCLVFWFCITCAVLCLVTQSCLCDPMDCSPPVSSVCGILQQEYWSRLLCPPSGHLPDPGIEQVSPAWQVDSLPLSHLGNPDLGHRNINMKEADSMLTINTYWKSGNSDRLYFLGLHNHCGPWLPPWIKDTCSLEEKLWQT